MPNEFIIKPITDTDLIKELEIIGYDKSYRHKMIEKFMYKTLKIYNLSLAQANILKQLALSVGADCGTHRDTIVGKIETSDVILGGSFAQLKKVCEKLTHQPFGLKDLSEKIEGLLVEKPTKTKLMGILNITDNSSSDGGEYNSTEKAYERFKQLVEEGADIIDMGAESTKPYAEPVSPEQQLEKLVPVLELIKKAGYEVPVSIDTRSSVVADKCLELGASIINDVSGLKYDNEMARVVAKHNATLILQHSLGSKSNMAEGHTYTNVVDEVFKDLYAQVEYARFNGIEKIIIDVGIGFDKSKEDNFEILNRIKEFYSLGYPVMVGVSRKSLLGDNLSNDEKDVLTLCLNSLLVKEKVDFLRVHNVKLHRQMLELLG